MASSVDMRITVSRMAKLIPCVHYVVKGSYANLAMVKGSVTHFAVVYVRRRLTVATRIKLTVESTSHVPTTM